VDPLRVARGNHARLDSELGQPLRELKRPLHTAPSTGRKVEGANENPH
jgi:hypothetical protein